MNQQEYRLLTDEAGYVELEDRWFVRLTGADCQSFFHNFCTADIKKLQPGEITEAFILNTKGKIIGLVHALAGNRELILTGHGDQASELLEHLDKYLIREDVTLVDATAELASVFVCGERAGEQLGFVMDRLPQRNRAGSGRLGVVDAMVWNVELAGFGFMMVCQRHDLEALKNELDQHGVRVSSREALEQIRVEHKTPWFGIDADDSNLPQELQRDEQAISFHKGCYLGQETVARIDARGRVNQLLVQLKYTGDDQPVAGDELILDGKKVGRLTSVVFSSHHHSHLGLGYVRRVLVEPGTELGNWTVQG